jgi:hypothetical protein
MHRGRSHTHFKWHAVGTIDGQPVNQKFLSITDFLDSFGGDKTPLSLDRYKTRRLRTGQQKDQRWQMAMLPIHEKRKGCTIYFD